MGVRSSYLAVSRAGIKIRRLGAVVIYRLILFRQSAAAWYTAYLRLVAHKN